MIIFFSTQDLAAKIYFENLRFNLNKQIHHFHYKDNKSIDNLKAIIIYSNGIQTKQINNLAQYYSNVPVIVVSKKKYDGLNILAYVQPHTTIRNLIKIIIGLMGFDSVTPEEILTKTEEVLIKNLCQGHSNKEIARYYNMPLSKVKYHLKNIYSKLGVRNRTQAALKLREIIV